MDCPTGPLTILARKDIPARIGIDKCKLRGDYSIMRISFEFADLEAFLAIAELGSFQRAAEKLHMSQPALTRRIQKLEASLGVTLFDRTTRSLKLTLAAKNLRSRAQNLVDDAAEATLALQDVTTQSERQRRGIVTVASVPSANEQILPNAIKRFRNEGQMARVRILDRLANDVAEAVSQGDADFGLSSIPALEPNLAFEPVIDDKLVLAMLRDHPLSEKSEVNWEDLTGDQLILPMKGTGNRMLIDEALAAKRQSLSWTYEVRRSTTALGLVGAGIGIAVLPKISLPSAGNSNVTSRELVAPSITRSLGIISREAYEMPPAAKEFCRVLTEVALGLAPGSANPR